MNKPTFEAKTYSTGAVAPGTITAATLAATEPQFASGKAFVLWGISYFCDAYTSGAAANLRVQTAAAVDVWTGRVTAVTGSNIVVNFPAGIPMVNGLQLVLGGGTLTANVTLVYSPMGADYHDLFGP